MKLNLLWIGCVALSNLALVAHGNYEGVAALDCTSLIQNNVRINQRSSKQQRSSSIGIALSEDTNIDEIVSFPSHRHGMKASLLQLLAKIPVMSAPPKMPSHPFPSLDWSEVHFPAAALCASALFAAGVLCSAGGIGGGGVYVTVLMVAGSLSPHDAVPLSKAIVFCGSLSSLALNLRKSLAPAEGGGQAKTLIDYNICRLVVPSALFGTLIGVLLNSMITPWLIVAMLSGILIMMTWMSCRAFYTHYSEECGTSNHGGSLPLDPNRRDSPQKLMSHRSDGGKAGQLASVRNVMCNGEGWGALLILLIVICCGALRAHAAACRLDLIQDPLGKFGRDACERPIINMFFGTGLAALMAPQRATSNVFMYGTVFLPATICLAIVIGYSIFLARREAWATKEIVCYCVMAVLTGCFAGLVGIGGGLVFSPFILWMTGDPAVAVATSSTCVIFTSSSTTFQYLFTDRITMSLTVIYGLANFVASYVGTSTVHMMDTLQNRKTLISGIVCLGVMASVILSVYKLTSMGAAH